MPKEQELPLVYATITWGLCTRTRDIDNRGPERESYHGARCEGIDAEILNPGYGHEPPKGSGGRARHSEEDRTDDKEGKVELCVLLPFLGRYHAYPVVDSLTIATVNMVTFEEDGQTVTRVIPKTPPAGPG